MLPATQAAASVWFAEQAVHSAQAESEPPPAVALPGRQAADVHLPAGHDEHASSAVSAVALQAAAA